MIVIWGASGHAKVVADILRLSRLGEVAGFLDDRKERKGTAFCGKTILGGRESLASLRSSGIGAIVIAVGNCHARLSLASIAMAEGFELVNALHPTAVISSGAQLGHGIVAAAMSVVNIGSMIGDNVILNTACSVDHECRIDEGVHVGPGAHLGGCVNANKGAWIGLGASIIDRVTIGEFAVVGAGSVVTRSIPARVVAYGAPARVKREISSHE